MYIFKRLPLYIKLSLTSLVPLIALIYFFNLVYKDQQRQITYIENFKKRLNITLTIHQGVSQLEKERRISLQYLFNNRPLQVLENQQASSDVTLEEIKSLTFDNGVTDINYTAGLNNWRNLIAQKEVQPSVIIENYQVLIDRLHAHSYLESDNPAILALTSDSLRAAFILSEMMDKLGVMRLEIYLRNLDPSKNPEAYITNFSTRYNQYQSFEKELLNIQNDTLSKHYLDLKPGSLDKILRYLGRIAERGTVLSIDPENWWETSEEAMDILSGFHKSLMLQIQDKVNKLTSTQEATLTRITTYLIALILLVLILLTWVSTSIVKQIRILQDVAHEIAQGETDIHLPPFPKDSLGHLAKSFIRIDKNNKKIVEAAKAIGNNNFSTSFALRGKNDALGSSILQMRDALQNYELKMSREIWVKSGITEINEVLLQKRKLQEMCKGVLEKLVQYVHGDIGTFYLLNEQNKLELNCTYALYDSKSVPKVISLGDSRIGKVASLKTPALYEDVPEDYLTVGSSLGQKRATQLLILPLVHNDQIQGVLEIASLQPFHVAIHDLMQVISFNIATSLHAAKSRERLQELLEETQAQAEELQTQHRELEHLNTQLEAQTHKLQASEEELRVQQEELMQSNQELEERSHLLEDKNQIIVERNLEIQKKAEELALSTRYKSEFLANMSHELRTPLNSILLLSRLLSENQNNKLSAEQVEYAEVIQSSGQGLLTLIDEILDLSKIEAGKMTLEVQEVSIEELVSSIKVLFEAMGKEKGLEMRWIIEKDVPETISTDRLRLEQILKNLLSNALKFTSNGFIAFSVQLQNEHTLLFQVQDSGIGIPLDKQEYIFEAFQQADGSTRRKFGGTGLGLSISKELSKLLQGTLSLESAPNQGSTFTLSLPLHFQATQDNPERTPIPEPEIRTDKTIESAQSKHFLAKQIPQDVPDDRNTIQSGEKLILIIEDDTAFANSLRNFAHSKGYKAIITVRGDQALELALQYQPTAILLDLQLPIKDGWQVMDELKSNFETRHIPIHMMSSYEIGHESIKKGAIDFINKPVAFEEMDSIFKAIEGALQKGSRKVLIVEENIKHAQALSFYLDSFGVKAEIKRQISDSVEALSNPSIDCVILDMGIPNVAAYKSLETIKESPGLENLPIIVFTGKNLSKVETQKIRQYADSIVVKTAHSYERILDEVALFLHLVEQNRDPRDQKHTSLQNPSFNEVLRGKTVLIADDDIRNIFALTKVLENYQMKIVAANDGKEALEYLQKNPEVVDIILMDMMMPNMDGYEATSHIRSDKQIRQVPILAVTAKAMQGDREKCIQAGASDYISKPIDMDQLISLLRVWLYN